jgi:hypothetical protein
VHGKDVFAVYQQNGAHGKELCTVKLLTTHGKEGLHGKVIIRRTAKNKTTAKVRNAHGKGITRHSRPLPCGSTSRTTKYRKILMRIADVVYNKARRTDCFAYGSFTDKRGWNRLDDLLPPSMISGLQNPAFPPRQRVSSIP